MANAFSPHNHHSCIDSGQLHAADYCVEHRLQFTPVRRRVLQILLTEHRAMGAYEVLDILKAEGIVHQPPAAYRALDFLVSHGFAQKIERLNAFVDCAHGGSEHVPAFLICRSCNSVAEAAALAQEALESLARVAGFKIERTIVEALGLCPRCQAAA
jgi:Fur family transcriptional regulator, zinc uptake regulator